MGRHHYPVHDALRPHRHRRKVIERARDAALRVGQVVISRQRKPGLDLGSLQEMIRFAAHHEWQTSEIGEDRSSPILTIQAQQHPFCGVVMGLSVALNGCDCLAQFGPILAVARVSKRGDPLMRMGLQDRGERTTSPRLRPV